MSGGLIEIGCDHLNGKVQSFVYYVKRCEMDKTIHEEL